MATYNPLHQLLEQSLRDFQEKSSIHSDAQDQELSQALHRLTGRLTEMLSSGSETSLSNDILAERIPISPNNPLSLSYRPQSNFVTSRNGVILLASAALCRALKVDMAGLMKGSISEFVPHEEWEPIQEKLLAPVDPSASIDFFMTILPAEGPSLKVACVVTPMVDQSLSVTSWHWDWTPEKNGSAVQSLDLLAQSLETQLFGGQSLDECLQQICEGLVRTFQFAFVWIATFREEYIQLRAHAVGEGLDWESQGPSWWTEISRKKDVIQSGGASEVFIQSRNEARPDGMDWFPPDFRLHESLCIPLVAQGHQSGILVLSAEKPKMFEGVVREWLRALGHQVERFVARGCQLERWRLHSVVLDSLNAAVCVTDLQGRLEWVNEAYTSLLGLSPEPILGTLLRSFPHNHIHMLKAPLSDPSDTAQCCVKTEIMETGMNGESLVLEQIVSPFVNKEGQCTHFVVVMHDVTGRKTQELLMKYQAYHDPLTDLPNRIMFEDRLQQALAHARRNGTLLALFFLDLDNFKTINDYHGHATGDRVLRVAAKRLGTCIRSTDTVARLCGDEFTVILQGLDRIQDIRQVAQKILECLTPPVRMGGKDIPIHISIGIAVYPKDSIDAHRLLEIADQSMYRAKERGGQCWYFATEEWNIE